MSNLLDFFRVGNGIPSLQGNEWVMFALIFLVLLFLPCPLLPFKKKTEEEKEKIEKGERLDFNYRHSCFTLLKEREEEKRKEKEKMEKEEKEKKDGTHIYQ